MDDLTFFNKAYHYMTAGVKQSLENLDKNVINNCLDLLSKGVYDKRVTIGGSGRSLQSALLLADALEIKGYGIRVNQVSNANLRPFRQGDLFIANSRSGKGKILRDALFAKEKGLKVIFITGNEELSNEFDNIILIKDSEERKEEYTPLGTEFEQASAVICSCIGCSFNEKGEHSFTNNCNKLIHGLTDNLTNLQSQELAINKFTGLIDDYLDINNEGVIYFRGLGINEVISKVAAIRYGHLSKEDSKDLRVVYEGHWKSRQKGDLVVLISGSGETDQMKDYASQAHLDEMKLFGFTSFKGSWVERMTNLHDGCLIINGRTESSSSYNKSVNTVKNGFTPMFELNTYLTLDSLLAVIARNNGITEADMKKTHRDKELE